MSYRHAMDIEVRHLRLVRSVAEHGSLTRAGEILHLTQSALSHQLREIESRLDRPLFLRVGKRMVLTPAGERLLSSARRVLEEIDVVRQDLATPAAERRRPLRIATECYTCYHWLPALLKAFQRKHADVDLTIDVESTNQPVAALLDGRLDLAIMSSRVGDRRLAVRPLFDDDLVAVAAPGHPLARRRQVALRDLNDETLFIYSAPQESTVVQRIIRPAGLATRIRQVQLTEAIVELVKAGMGVSILARWAVQPYVADGSLVVLPLKAPGLARRWNAVMLKQHAQLAHVVDFIELMSRAAPRRPGLLPAVGRERVAPARSA